MSAMLDRLMLICLTLMCAVLAIFLYRHDRPVAQVNHQHSVARSGESTALPDAGKILDTKLPLVQFRDVPFDQAMVELGELAHANVLVRIDAMRVAHVEPYEKVTLQLHDVTLRQALSIVIAEAEHRWPTERLGFAVVDQIIVVSTYGDFEPLPVTMTHNVRDLIAKQISRGDSAEIASDKIMRAVMKSVEPDSWKDAGGTIGSVREVGGLLLVTHTALHQAEIADLLEKLRGPEGDAILNPPPPATQGAEQK
jgi:hypothetical protein